MRSTPGKTVGQRTYIYVGAPLDASVEARLIEAERLAGVRRSEHYNLIRVDADGPHIALLNYPGFFDDPFPILKESWLVDSEAGVVSYRTYADSLNPPILHRKALLLTDDHPRRAEYAALTEAAEAIGLFDQPTRIGYRRQWLALVQEKGYRIDGHMLVPLGNAESDEGDSVQEIERKQDALHSGWQAARQLTALVRYGFSAPVQMLARYGFLDGRYRMFDYGCGRGDDLRGLIENGLQAAGWNPYYAPEQPLAAADIVNLGFVVNVIEDFDERLEALTRAWSLAERLLVVSVMLANQNDVRGQRFRDGVLTRRGTFQKYYTQAEIKAFIAAALDEEPIPVAPGVLYVFRDKDAKQRFLVDRYRSRRNCCAAHYGPRPDEFQEMLASQRRAVEGFELVRSRSIPNLDAPCGRFLTFRQLIECGDTQAQTGLANLPKRPESYNALFDLAFNVLDPVIDYFGMIRLTYGFCSPELARKIPGRIDPKRDQHAAHELNRRGYPVCERLGAAVDFIVDDEDMLEVAQWVVANTSFDRLYFYGNDLPIHVSFGPNHDRQVIRMLPAATGRLCPKVTAAEAFLALT